MTDPVDSTSKLAGLVKAAGLSPLNDKQSAQFSQYLDLLLKWNARLNLTAVRDADSILSRHFVECIAAAQALPKEIATLLDLGSGAGFPGIPVSICRAEIAVTLAESQGKKAAFLQEAVRTLGLGAKVHARRAEDLQAQFDCVALRAVDRMEQAVEVATTLVRPGGWLGVMTTVAERDKVLAAAGPEFSSLEPIALPGGEHRILVLSRRAN